MLFKIVWYITFFIELGLDHICFCLGYYIIIWMTIHWYGRSPVSTLWSYVIVIYIWYNNFNCVIYLILDLYIFVINDLVNGVYKTPRMSK